MIRTYEPADWAGIWEILEPVFRAGRTYVFPRDIGEDEARRIWIDAPEATFVFVDEGEILGSYYIKPNQPGQGSHICNCGYVVSGRARGKGVASRMCGHSQLQAVERGFLGMQFNLVVSTNEGAVRLWKKLGFDIVGTLPSAFNEPEKGLVDAYVMFKRLGAESCEG
ncbi:GNAT family N-acetyltransferase [Luteolibacter yonseiensis]|uniref:GNAT family N-acetyltransferase n=2 Tax=Luteolibacter yonseiensis TaxID=1144680 RepID=A0A934VC46_9BACT|nr:GNAT family N-acetyltransferase [Luteolibacter yonseiensis]MBK1816785.1 GNAT family N-acetyltransferase [Luteolibacter yonseiensis]